MSNKTISKTISKITASRSNKNCLASYYIAYGSNLSVEQMAIRCPDATIIGTEKIIDYKLVFRFHADIEKCRGSYVPVLVWKISKSDEKRLDIYEGVAGGYYHQEKVQVLMDNEVIDGVKDEASNEASDEANNGRATLTGMVYVMNNQNDTVLPDDYYLQIIEDGYTHFNFDKEILRKALQEAQE